MDLRQRPGEGECSGYHVEYVAKVPDGDILETLRAQGQSITEFIRGIDSSLRDVIHPPYGWSIRQVLEHCIEAERVFGYRILRFATGDKTELPGWDENAYADADYGPHADLPALADEYGWVRSGNVALLSRLSEEAWNEVGSADQKNVSVRALAWLMAGHWLHHEAILRSRLSA